MRQLDNGFSYNIATHA